MLYSKLVLQVMYCTATVPPCTGWCQSWYFVPRGYSTFRNCTASVPGGRFSSYLDSILRNPEDYAFLHLPGFELARLAGLAGYRAAGMVPVRVFLSTGVHCTGLLLHCTGRVPKLIEILHFLPRFTAAHGLPVRPCMMLMTGHVRHPSSGPEWQSHEGCPVPEESQCVDSLG